MPAFRSPETRSPPRSPARVRIAPVRDLGNPDPAPPPPGAPRQSANQSVPAGGCPALVSNFPSGGEDMAPLARGATTAAAEGWAAARARGPGGKEGVGRARLGDVHCLLGPRVWLRAAAWHDHAHSRWASHPALPLPGRVERAQRPAPRLSPGS